MSASSGVLKVIQGITERYQLVFPARLFEQMFGVVGDALSFAALKEALEQIGVEAQLYQLDFSTLLALDSNQFIIFHAEKKVFFLVEKVKADAILFAFEDQWIDRKTFEQNWDGYTLVFEPGEMPFFKSSLGQLEKRNRLHLLTQEDAWEKIDFWVKPLKEIKKSFSFQKYIAQPADLEFTGQASMVLLGAIAGDDFSEASTVGFETVLEGPNKALLIGYTFKKHPKEVAVSFLLPVALAKGKQVLQFHFTKEPSTLFYAYLGLRGSYQGLFYLPN